ncbi:MAG: T9SS type A sorting domain-containing protein [Flavobacteriales bacterium]|nr:T9SS type A sorting domain-containing protein [Flavobacteriales bacterium]
MKRIFIFFLLIVSGTVSAQTYAPFPLDETSEWRVWNAYGFDPCVINKALKYYIDGDTVLNGNTYQVINYSGVTYPTPGIGQNCTDAPIPISGFKTFMRAENGIYYTSVDGINEQVLFDFTLNIGDFFEGVEIDSSDYVNVNGISCKRLWLTLIGNYPEVLWIMEGIGHSNGLFEDMIDHVEYLSDLLCYSENSIPLFFGEEGGCDMTISVAELSKEMFTISPNPTTGKFFIQTDRKSIYRVFDLFGRVLEEGKLVGQSEIDLTDQPNGVYFLSLQTERQAHSVKIIKQ